MFVQSNAKFSPGYINLSHAAFLLKSVDIKKASGLDKILSKLLKTVSDLLDVPLSQAINNSLVNRIFPDGAKVAIVSHIEGFSLSEYMSPFVSAYREGFCTWHVLVRSIEEWRKNLVDDYIVGGVLNGPI